MSGFSGAFIQCSWARVIVIGIQNILQPKGCTSLLILQFFLSIVQKGGIHQEKRIKKIITFGALAVNLFVAKFVTLGQRLIFEGKKTLKKNFWQEVDYHNLQKKITRGRGSQFPRPTCF